MAVSISKTVAYAVVGPKDEVKISKAVAYVVLAPIPPGVVLSKAVAYVVIGPAVSASTSPVLIMICD